MRFLVRTVLIALLISSVLNMSVFAAAGQPLGMVVVADNAHLSGVSASTGADVFTGDALQTDRNGALRVKVGSTQLYLTASSAATLGQETNPLRVKLSQGTLGFSSGVGGQFEVETPVGVVRSADGQRAFGEITILGPQKILVASYHGSLVVSGSGMERTVTEGNAYNVTFVPSAEPAAADPNPASPTPAFHRAGPGSLVFDLVVLGVMGVTAALVWHFYAESDSTPNN